MEKVWAKDIKPDMELNSSFLVQEIKEFKKKNGDPFVILKLSDKTGSIDAKIWDMTVESLELKAGSIVNFTIKTNLYNGALSCTALDYGDPAEELNTNDYVKASEYSPEGMWTLFKFFIDTYKSDHFKVVAKDMFDEESKEAFKLAPAAKSMHHAFYHGLLEHTLQMLQCGEALLKLHFFKDLNKDLCMFGLMFHDFGKIYEYSTEPGFNKRIQGVLVPHIPMAAARIFEIANKHGVPEEVRDHMMHVVLAHHRRLEWGSPVTFACPEAAFVHYVDNLHGDVFGILQAREASKTETFKHGFGSDACTVLKTSFNEIIGKDSEDGF